MARAFGQGWKGGLLALGLAAGATSASAAESGLGRLGRVGTSLLRCTTCHSAATVTPVRGTARRTGPALSTVVALPEDTETRLATYLAEAFPPRGHRAATLVPGLHRVTFEQWQVPT